MMRHMNLTTTQKGIFYMVLGMLTFSIMNAIIKDSTSDYHDIQIVFFRCLFATIPCAIALTLRREWAWNNVIEQRKYHALRAVLLAIGLTALFTGIHYLPLSNSMALYFSSSLFLVALSPIILKERVIPFQWFAVIIGFIGVMVIAQPQADASIFASLVIIGGAMLESLYNLFGRRLSQNTNSLMLTFLGSLFPAMVVLIPLPFFWVMPDLFGWIALITLGIGGGLGQLCVTKAYQYAPAGVLAPIIYTSILWSILLDLILYQDFPSNALFIGSAIIIGSGLMIIFREKRRSKKIPS
jgi:drug/metabolite transporter (DMT)-like permease